MTEPTTDKATFTGKSGSSKGQKVEVHFNPASLEYTIQNQMEEKGQGAKRKQFVRSSSAKLVMELYFDTTYNGEDVRLHTKKLAAFLQPIRKSEQRQVPAVVEFQWGSYKFQGVIEQFKETIDFFSATGVPLRAKINLTMSSQDIVFSSEGSGTAPKDEAVEVPGNQNAVGPGSGNQSTTSLASGAGNPEAGRAIAALNNLDSMRFPTGPLTVGATASLQAAAAFSAGASIGFGASAGISAGASFGASAGASAGFGASAGASFGASAGASAGFGASAGASASFGASAGASAGFGASAGASAGFGASAGASASFGASAGASAGFGASAGASAGFGASAGASAGFGASAGASAGFGASAGASASFGASAGAGASFGAFAGASAGFGASASAGAAFGASASAGVPATAGAFAGLRTQITTTKTSLDPQRLVMVQTTSYSTSSSTGFTIGGQASLQSSASLSADVGAGVSAKTKIRFY